MGSKTKTTLSKTFAFIRPCYSNIIVRKIKAFGIYRLTYEIGLGPRIVGIPGILTCELCLLFGQCLRRQNPEFLCLWDPFYVSKLCFFLWPREKVKLSQLALDRIHCGSSRYSLASQMHGQWRELHRLDECEWMYVHRIWSSHWYSKSSKNPILVEWFSHSGF